MRQGQYLAQAAGCDGCHTDHDQEGPRLAGGGAIETAFGTFYAPNITPDAQHGLGLWTEDDFVRAMSEGVGRDGSQLYPVFPYTSYTRIRSEDLHALWAYLSTVPPIARANRPHELAWYAQWRPLLALWKRLWFDPGWEQAPL